MKFVSKSTVKRLPALLLVTIFAASNASADQVTIDSRDFIPVFGNSVYGESGAGNLVCVGGNAGKLFIAQVPLPPAPVALDIKQIAMWGVDLSSTDASVQLDRYCQTEFSPSTPVRTVLTSVSSSGSGGNYFDASALNFRVSDQQTCIYMLSVQLGVNGCADSSLSIARVRVRYDVVQQPVIDAIFSNGFEN